MVVAGVGDFEFVSARRADSAIKFAACQWWAEVSTHVPESGALWDRLGRGGCGHGLLRLRSAILTLPQTISRPAHRLASTDSGKARLDDHRDRQGATTRAASRPSQRSKQGRPPAHLDG